MGGWRGGGEERGGRQRNASLALNWGCIPTRASPCPSANEAPLACGPENHREVSMVRILPRSVMDLRVGLCETLLRSPKWKFKPFFFFLKQLHFK